MTRITGPVRIVGAGLLGTSIGLALMERGVDVQLADASPANLRTAVDYGAGRPASPTDAPVLVVVCVPPDVTATAVAAELERYPEATVTDVASVKRAILAELAILSNGLDRYVPGHPLAGRERSGPSAGRADLFTGRPWVLCPHPALAADRLADVEALLSDLEASVVHLDVAAHDQAVALISHAPQVVSSLLAARLVDAPAWAINLAGGGLRDTTRIAASDPELWLRIFEANTESVLAILVAYRNDLDLVIGALGDLQAPGARREISQTLGAGNAGVARIPGKHGVDERYTTLTVVIDDRPGQLAALLTEVGEIGVNLEDLRLEHSPSARVGLVELSVQPPQAARLSSELTSRGWRIGG